MRYRSLKKTMSHIAIIGTGVTEAVRAAARVMLKCVQAAVAPGPWPWSARGSGSTAPRPHTLQMPAAIVWTDGRPGRKGR
jgi:hypothetical protein